MRDNAWMLTITYLIMKKIDAMQKMITSRTDPELINEGGNVLVDLTIAYDGECLIQRFHRIKKKCSKELKEPHVLKNTNKWTFYDLML